MISQTSSQDPWQWPRLGLVDDLVENISSSKEIVSHVVSPRGIFELLIPLIQHPEDIICACVQFLHLRINHFSLGGLGYPPLLLIPLLMLALRSLSAHRTNAEQSTRYIAKGKRLLGIFLCGGTRMAGWPASNLHGSEYSQCFVMLYRQLI